MLSVIFSIIAGATMSIQGVINTRLSDKIGLYEANMFVQATAFILSIIVMFILGKGSLASLLDVKKVYWLGGILGIIITITVMLGIKNLSPTVAISIILISQLLVAFLIDFFGILDSKKVAFEWTKCLGLVLMIGGILLFKFKTIK